jgi:hypothetical protein
VHPSPPETLHGKAEVDAVEGFQTFPLALLPNGEAVRPDEVRRVLVEPAPALLQEQGERFAVWLLFGDGERRAVATGLTRADATDLGRRCARAVNEALKGGG